MRLFSRAIITLLFVVCQVQAATSIDEFSQNKSFHSGFVPFYLDGDTGKVFLKIENFGEDMLFQSSLPHGLGSNDIGLDRGQLGDTRLVRFERVGDKVFLRQLNTYYRANSDNVLEQQAMDEAFASAIIWGFGVVASDANSQAVVIDYTPFLLSDIHGIGDKLKKQKQGNFSIDSSRSGLYSKRTKGFADNTELEATVTFKGSDAGQYLRSVTPESTAFTVNLHHSFIRLPDNNYQARVFHPYSGYWSIDYADYASAIDQPLVQRVIPRHRLKKQNPDADISEAVEPIVYYLDAGVPEPVRSALLEGARWWDQAFAAAGYKNAFQVKMLPPDADPMDVRYNVIQWVHRATRGWSYGSSVIDPRTGEIIKGHVTLGSLRVRQDYLIALGLTSPFTDENADTSAMKEMALARIRQLSAHEVGHTLGIAHNFAASVNARASVMDYPHPLVTLDDKGNVSLENAYTKDIGDWDKFAIAYGYGEFTSNEAEALAKLVDEAQAKGLKYISDPDARAQSGSHASAHLWDNGADATTELARVMKVRAAALAKLGLNSIADGTPLSELENVLVPIYNFHRYQVEATVKLIAGEHYSYEVKQGNKAQGVDVVDSAQQQAALVQLIATLTPEFLDIPANISQLITPKAYGYSRTRESFASNTGLSFDPITAAQASAQFTLDLLLNPARLARLNLQHANDDTVPSVQSLSAELLANTVKQKAQKGRLGLIQQRTNQAVVDALLALYHNKNLVAEVRAEVYLVLSSLNDWLNSQTTSRKAKENPLYGQYKLLAHQIAFGMAKGKMISAPSEAKMPPGSPIGQ